MEPYGVEHWRLRPQDGANALERFEEAPSDPSPDNLLVRPAAWSLNYRDLMIQRGTYGELKRSPLTPLSDMAGEVIHVGENVTGFSKGDRVVSSFFQNWAGGPFNGSAYGSDLGFNLDGTLKECVALNRGGAVRIPDSLSYETAATLTCAGVTAWNAVRGVQPGQTVLTLGTGGVSLFALQFATALAARVIVTSSRDDKIARAKAMGAAAGVNYRKHEDWDKEVLRQTEGRGADLIVENGGAQTFQHSVNALAPGGTLSLLGQLTGKSQAVNVQPFVYKSAHLRGIYVGSCADLAEVVAFVAKHSIQPQIAARIPFAEAPKAWEAQASGPFGKVVIVR
jgi:NADPH:quinone reductase-like Zn-dependent oxidoreductase